jgi:hypothetical protein
MKKLIILISIFMTAICFANKLTVLKNMLFGSKDMNDKDLNKKVSSIREELKYIVI